MAAAGVSIERVTFGYGVTAVLDDISLDVAQGEFFAFLGPSGSGKTTLLRLIAGFGRPQSGRILVGERDVSDLPPWRRNVGLVFQNYALWPHMTVAQNVGFGLEMRKVGRAERDRRVRAALDMVDLAALADRRPAQLSGGQQQRVALARTLVIEPEVLLLDEPLSNLDAQRRVEMRGELIALHRKTGLTTIYVTHDQEEANATCDRMAVLDGGRLQQVGAPLDLYDRPANRFVAGFLGAANLVDGAVEGGRFVAERFGAAPLPAPAASGPATLMLRPQNLTLNPAGDTAWRSEGRIVMREFLGATLRYEIEAGGRRFAVERPHTIADAPLAVGDAAAVGFAAGAIRLLPR